MLVALNRALQKLAVVVPIAASALVLGCGEAKPVRVVSLKVDNAGVYELDAKRVEPPDLKHELRALRNSGSTIQLHIYSAIDTKYEAVGKAVVAAQEAGIAQVSFVTEPPK
jgi:biopolymer transport protein ExbD